MNPKSQSLTPDQPAGVARRLAHGLNLGIRGLAEILLRAPLQLLFWWEGRERRIGAVNELAFMYAFLFKHLARTCPGRVLDVGTGTSSLPHLLSHCGSAVVAIDKFSPYWQRRPLNRHYRVVADDICRLRTPGTFDLIACIDVIQHLPEHRAAVQSMAGRLRPGGCLVIGCLYNERHYVPDAYRLEGSRARAAYACQIVSRREIERWSQDNNLRIVDEELWNCFSGEYWGLGERLQPARRASPQEAHQAICLCLEKAADRAAESAGRA